MGMNNLIYPVLAVAILTGCGQNEKKGDKAEGNRTSVSITKVTSERVVVDLKYSGTIEPLQTIPLTFQINGTVEKVMVQAGDAVKKGQVLATVEKDNYQSLYDMTYSKYQQAKDAYDRLKKVHDEGSLPEIKWVEMQTNLEQAKSSLEVSKSNIGKCTMRAPVNAIVGRRNIEPGMSSISISSAPIELVEITSVYVKISVPENEIGKIKKGIKATFIVSALNNASFEGKVTNVSPVADVFSRTYEVKITVPNPQLNLKPGMVCDVTLNMKSEKDLVLVPYGSVTKDGEGNTYVYLVNVGKKKVNKQIVKTGNYEGGNLEILSGLAPGQLIVSEGKEKLMDNSLINL
jgi:RND family efflux transporter MFP subunit